MPPNAVQGLDHGERKKRKKEEIRPKKRKIEVGRFYFF